MAQRDRERGLEWEPVAIPILGLFEAHLTVDNLERAIAFYRDRLEYLAMLPEPPRPEAGVVSYSMWRTFKATHARERRRP